ncbi:Ig-like domain-containing protein [Deinococcus yavapaiensis]|uniref:Ig-like protein group 2 n=1 Tax=Deinococcus yavapaiensis KR-236 TaxID=694435 RepID=A0A318S6E6_9DEIO|nr:Ig-like domain-containing protein [Deinococcus yavapaiensis]PYE53783.1 Ig-like protein group 2 [Deinococcus yavapaiensis KR-236]
MSRIRSLSAIALLSLTLSACSTFTPPTSASDGEGAVMEAAARLPVARLEVTPTSSLLTAIGASTTLQATAFDASGRKVSASVKWTSSNPAAVTVDSKGKVTAKVAVGSSQITADVGGVKSKPVLVTVAKLNDNALVVSDAQIASGAVALLPAPSGSLTGARFQVTLSGVHPKAGQVLLSSGTSPISGRVLSSVSSGGQAVVTLETVPLGDIYRELNVAQHATLTSSDVVPLTGAQAPEKVERHADGSLTVSYRLPKNETRRSAMRAQGLPNVTLPGPFAKVEWSVGPFKCNSTLDTLLSGDLLSLKIENKIEVDFAVMMANGQLQNLVAVTSGELSGTITGGFDVDLGAQGELKCKAIFAEVPVPISGPLAMIMAPTVPIGLSVGLEGKLKLGKAQFAVEGKVTSKKRQGITYSDVTDTITSIDEGDTTTTLTPKVKLPNFYDDFRFEGSLAVQGVTGLNIRAFPWLGGPSIEAVELTFGPKLEGNFSTETAQAGANDYASSYTFKQVVALTPGSTLQDLAGLVRSRGQWKIGNFGVQREVTISRSPNGTLSGPAQAKAGQATVINVDLNPANIEFVDGWYSPSEVRLYRDRDGVLTYVGVATPTPWQTHFEFPWTPASSDVGQTVTLRAFVSSGLLSFPLELGDDAKITVAVSAADADPLPPPAPVPSAWYGTITHSWSHDSQQTSSDGSQYTKHETGKHTCTFGAIDASGQQAFDWTYTVDHWSKSLYADGKYWIYTAQGDRSGSTTRSAGTLGIDYMPEDYITGIKKFYWWNDQLTELGNWWLPMNTSRFCSLGGVVDEDPSPDVIRGQSIFDSPEGSSITTVNLTRK